MAAGALSDPGMLGGPQGPRRKRSPITFGHVLIAVGVGLAIILAYVLAPKLSVSDRPNAMKTTRVILPPPPPPPPPPPQPKPVEKPPEPTIAPPVEQPVDTPPPPQAANEPAAGDSALSAREGAGPSNYGLARGDGGGTRIGGKPGGGSGMFAFYAGLVEREMRLAFQRDRDVAKGRYTIRLALNITPDGRIQSVRFDQSSGDAKRDEAIRRLLVDRQLSSPPPSGLSVVRLEFNARPAA